MLTFSFKFTCFVRFSVPVGFSFFTITVIHASQSWSYSSVLFLLLTSKTSSSSNCTKPSGTFISSTLYFPPSSAVSVFAIPSLSVVHDVKYWLPTLHFTCSHSLFFSFNLYNENVAFENITNFPVSLSCFCNLI